MSLNSSALGSLVVRANTRIETRGGSQKNKFLAFLVPHPFFLEPTAVRSSPFESMFFVLSFVVSFRCFF